MESNQNLLTLIEELERRVGLLEDMVNLIQDEMTETTNSIYEVSNSLEARIDILSNCY